MSGKLKFLFVGLYIVGFSLLLKTLTLGKNMGILDPKGVMASQEKDLIIISILLMLVVVVPVYAMTIIFAWKYRSTNNKHEKYAPTEDHNTLEEFIWWAIPCVIVIILGSITWTTSHQLDPYRPLDSDVKPINIQVVALDWKWLFIYPDEGIATVGFVEIPEKTPVNFEITSDAPMNSFWIPQLAGQVYAMAGMDTKLHIMADEVGSYRGLSSNFSGDGFTEMKFTVRSVSNSDFARFTEATRQNGQGILLGDEYAKLSQPSKAEGEYSYRAVKSGLFNDILMKYMMPKEKKTEETTVPSMHMNPEATTTIMQM